MILRLVVWLTLGFLLTPIFIIVLFSFHVSPSLAFPFEGLSLRWYEEMVANAQLRAALVKSLVVATATSTVTLVLGTAVALAWLRLGRRERRLLESLTITPIALPGLFIGVALLVALSAAGVALSTWTIVIAHVVVALPVVVVAMRARLELFDPSLEEAARDLGASQLQTFRLVTLPIIAPTLISSAILTFAISLDEFIVTAFVAGTETTLPMYVWSMMRRTVTPLINAVSALILLASIVMLLTALLVGRVRRRSDIANRLTE